MSTTTGAAKKKNTKKDKDLSLDVMEAGVVPEGNIQDHVVKLIGIHKKFSDGFISYTKEFDGVFKNYTSIIKILQQEHKMLKDMLEAANDPLQVKENKKKRKKMMEILEKEACVGVKITNILQQLQRDKLNNDLKFKVIEKKRQALTECLNQVAQQRYISNYIIELEEKKHKCVIKLNMLVNNNKQLRTSIDSKKRTRMHFEKTYKKLVSQIKALKEEKKYMLTNAQQFIEDRESMASMINMMTSGQEKEAALYAQKIENMKQMIRQETKTTEFLVPILNERTELKELDQMHKTQKLEENLENETKILEKLKEEQEAIQDITEEKEKNMITMAYNQIEADKMALFNYNADLDGELINLKQQQRTLKEELETLQKEDTSISEEFTVKMHEYEGVYEKLAQESIDCSHKSTEVHAAMDLSKLFIECTFKMLGCSMQKMEQKLGLDTEVNPKNMSVFLTEVESDIAEIIRTLNTSGKENIESESRLDFVADFFQETLHNTNVENALLPNPLKDYPEYSQKNPAEVHLCSKKSLVELAEESARERNEAVLRKKRELKKKFEISRVSSKNNLNG